MTEEKPPKTQEEIDHDNVEYERLAAIHNSARRRWLTPTLQLTPWLPADRDALVPYLNMPEIYSYINGPPFPFLPSHADKWIRGRPFEMTKNGTPLNHCIRDMTKGGKPIGSVYVTADSDDNLEGDGVGYWLSPEYHGQGIMTKALKLMLQEVSIKEAGKRKIIGHAHIGNWASRRTMEKAGFVNYPELETITIKDGKEIPTWTLILILTEEDLEQREVVEEAVPSPSLVQ
ncbi:hypothetical protein BGZ93_002390 [Podila epicladia]|nr:hypothetical protein BGZ92_006290 [Podila epicladia]KAG0097601.1 hypothetical protein BGZ93_002390 [Podila epicladia]